MDNDELNRQHQARPSGLSADVDPEVELKQQLLGRLIVGQTIAVSLLTIMVTVTGLLIPESSVLALIPLGPIAVIVGLVSYWLLRRGRRQLASYFFLIGTAAAITFNVYVRGYQDASAIYYLWPILAACALLDMKGGVIVTASAAILYITLVVIQHLGYRPPPMPYDPEREGFLTVGSRLLMFFLLAFLGSLSGRNLGRALQQTRQAARRWRELNETLEERVAERTRDLERHTRYLEATATVAREATGTLGNLQELLKRVVGLISKQFGFYHTGIFLLDPSGEWAVLQAASSEGGQRMLARGHRLKVSEEGIVGHVTGQGKPRTALDVGADAVFFDNPDLPETRSEMALPLRARGEQGEEFGIIGALDVQSTEPAAFTDEDVAVLQILADQLALAISNARLFQQVQQSLEIERRAFSELSRQAWRELLRRQPDLGFARDKHGTSPASGQRPPQMEIALRTGEVTQGEQDGTTLAVPVKVRGQVIGVIDAQRPDDAGEWTSEQITLLVSLADQLGAALESARLYQDTQRRAIRERLTREIADKIRRARSVEDIIQTAVDELFDALGTSRTFVRLGAVPQGQEDGLVSTKNDPSQARGRR